MKIKKSLFLMEQQSILSLLLLVKGNKDSQKYQRNSFCVQEILFLKYVFIFLLLCSFPFPLFADAQPLLKGYATITWVKKGEPRRFEQVIVIDSKKEVHFETKDDFGNTSFTLHFTKKKLEIRQGGAPSTMSRGKKILAIPITQEELIAVLLNEDLFNGPFFSGGVPIYTCDRNAPRLFLSNRVKDVRVIIGQEPLPLIVLESNTAHVEIQWKTLTR